jgi:DNA-binding PadR family transcriptional regulator
MQGAVNHALLGVLSLHPMSGYDIENFVVEHLSYFWRESYGQIYPALQNMADSNLVRIRVPDAQPDRQIFELTDSGRAELTRWLGDTPQTPSFRVEIVLKMFFGRLAQLADLLRHVEVLRQRHTQAVQKYAEVEKWLRREKAGDPNLPFWLISVDYGRRYSNFLLEWCDATVTSLARIETAAPVSGAKPRR